MVRTSTKRPAAILLIVLVMLALFAIIGISFVLFAQAEATSANINKQAFTDTPAGPPDPLASANEALRQMIYPVNESGASVASAFRGHEIARTMYGYCVNNGATNNVPYSGIGTFAENLSNVRSYTYNTGNAYQPIGGPPLTVDRRNVINYTANFPDDTVVDPEHTFDTARNLGQHIYGVGNPPTPVGRSPSSVYVGKNANYTYPDRNNAFLAMMDPDTGMIVVPSFHRPELFNTGNTTLPAPPWSAQQAAQFQLQSLAPVDPNNPNAANPNWSNAQGRFMILRPRPYDHRYDSGDGRGLVSDYPYPPPNPDGSFTGDVQNYRYANGVQRNDSVWLHANLPPVLYRGRMLQPMIAPLILPLDGRVNLQVAGNRRGSVPVANSHGSHHGLAPYEINAEKILGATGMPPTINGAQEARDIRSYLYGTALPMQPQYASGSTANQTARFDPSGIDPNGVALADYSLVNWRAIAANPLQMPAGNSYFAEPQKPATGWENNFGGTVGQQHQSLFNPYFLRDTISPSGRILNALDFRELGFRYSTTRSRYAPPLYGDPDTLTSFNGDAPQHPSGRVRANTTLYSNSLNRPGMMPNFARLTLDQYGMPPATGVTPNAPYPQQLLPQTFSATTPAAQSDFVQGQGHRSLAASLGPIDLNRPLPDYRLNPSFSLIDNTKTNTNAMPTQAPIADRARQVFAKDIFDRLVIATGAYYANLDINTGRPTGFGTPNSPSFNAARYLAQLAANIVDYIDIDDVCTAFVWNPDPALPANVLPEQHLPHFQTPGNHMVFGVEKTRLAINEVYSEVTNHESEASAASARQPFQVRFFIEVINPTNGSPAGSIPAPALGNGAAPLVGSRDTPTPVNWPVYQFQIFKNGTTLHDTLYNPANNVANVTGAPMGATPALTASVPVTVPAPTQFQPYSTQMNIEANNGAAQTQGFREIVPQGAMNHTETPQQVYKPANGTVALPTGLSYDQAAVAPRDIQNLINNTLNPSRQGVHAVLLQRLANPHLPVSPFNPYITVDAVWDIKVNDAIRVGTEERVGMTTVPGTRPPNEPTPIETRTSQARTAPMYGYRGATPNASYLHRGRNMPQQGVPGLATRFRSHNDTITGLTLAQPFEWLTHLDRKVTSPAELLHVAGVKPHELLHYFVTMQTPPPPNPNSAPPRPQLQDKYHHLAAWKDPVSNLARALEMLTVKPWIYGIPVGGRQPGKININMIWHRDVFNALLDQQTGGNSFNNTDLDTLWNSLIVNGPMARTGRFPLVSTTADEVNTPVPGQVLDRPIKSLGIANYTATAGSGLPSGHNADETMLRNNPSAPVPGPAFLIANTDTTRPHPYLQAEMFRKAYNNLSTTTDTYMVLFTIGYFEIRKSADNTRYVPVLGREAYNEIPGDLRIQYGAIIDRSMLAVSPLPPTTGTPQQAANIFFSELTREVDPNDSNSTGFVTIDFRANVTSITNGITIIYEGQSIVIRKTPATGSLAANEIDVLVLGTGADAVYVRLTNNPSIQLTGDMVNGTVRVSIPAALYSSLVKVPGTNNTPAVLRKYYAGEAVGSAVPGNPGPQPAFDPNSPTYRQVVRDFFEIK